MGFFSRLRSTKSGIDASVELAKQPGFADMIRQGQEAYAQMATSGELQELMADGQLASRLATSGIPMPATVRSVEKVESKPTAASPGEAPPGWGPVGEAPAQAGFHFQLPSETKVNVEVQPPGKPAYEASFTQALPEQYVATLAPGTTITVRVDPSDPSAMLLWGGAPQGPTIVG